MARPLEFDREGALDTAIRVFARHGYEAASTSDLLTGMGIARQSLYGAFGDKRRLFLEALARYNARSLEEMRTALAASPSAGEAIEAALVVGLGGGDDLESGCLGVGSVAEFGRSDPDINALTDAAGVAVVEAFAARVSDGMVSGEFDATLDAGAAGRMLLALRSGLKVATRGGADIGQAREMARLAMRGLRA